MRPRRAHRVPRTPCGLFREHHRCRRGCCGSPAQPSQAETGLLGHAAAQRPATAKVLGLGCAAARERDAAGGWRTGPGRKAGPGQGTIGKMPGRPARWIQLAWGAEAPRPVHQAIAAWSSIPRGPIARTSPGPRSWRRHVSERCPPTLPRCSHWAHPRRQRERAAPVRRSRRPAANAATGLDGEWLNPAHTEAETDATRASPGIT